MSKTANGPAYLMQTPARAIAVTYEPETVFMSDGLSGMGIAAAVAAQLKYPDEAVVAVVGDGGVLMMLHDLVLVRELRSAPHRGGAHGSQSKFDPGRPRGERFYQFASVAKAFGVQGERARNVWEAKRVAELALEKRTA